MKTLKSRKALSPVVASIILIAVTVAVSLAVAIWMGALTTGFMGGTEQLRITDVSYDKASNKVYIQVTNTGEGTVTIIDVRIDDKSYTNYNANLSKILPYPMPKGNSTTLTLSFTNWPFQSGVTYTFTLVTSKGNQVSYPKAAPS